MVQSGACAEGTEGQKERRVGEYPHVWVRLCVCVYDRFTSLLQRPARGGAGVYREGGGGGVAAAGGPEGLRSPTCGNVLQAVAPQCASGGVGLRVKTCTSLGRGEFVGRCHAARGEGVARLVQWYVAARLTTGRLPGRSGRIKAPRAIYSACKGRLASTGPEDRTEDVSELHAGQMPVRVCQARPSAC